MNSTFCSAGKGSPSSGNVPDIVEVDKDGSVPDLKVKNNSARMILILDGEELVGAKQNRIVNTTVLVMAITSLIIPVRCVGPDAFPVVRALA